MSSKNKKLCSDPDCFGLVDKDDFVEMADKTDHPLSTKCWNCQTDLDRKKLKAYRKKRRKALKKQLINK